ncbi:hypothetical protein SteCoe_18494 [Stentor coeruleus]|uniref:PPM-type phosphatase domain-containing protein n=1 Tax=Stentor coeruleus TaxID=5963 RepID=A0A1R2BWD5_9CILI|nr:hypothetical protein SteCoe_18494 [Stentor coeruleus]
MEPYELLLKCTSGLYSGKFIYLNSNEPEILGSGSFEALGVTASLQNVSLEPVHSKIEYKNDFFISDMSNQKGTWLKLIPNNLTPLLLSDQLKIGNIILTVTALDTSLPNLELSWGSKKIQVSKSLKISSKTPTDYIFPSLDYFSLEIIQQDTSYIIKVYNGIISKRIIKETKLSPGFEIEIGNLIFEVCLYNYGKWSNIGHRVAMEDTDCVIQDLNILDQPVSFYGVFDGHGGNSCSEFLKANLYEYLQRKLRGNRNIQEWREMIIQAFNECDLEYNKNYPEISKVMGATALIVMIIGRNIVVVNTGDSRAVMSRRGEVLQLSNDHKPDLFSEKTRIEEAGGFVTSGRVLGKLGVSRAFGDFEFKLLNKKTVICEPEVEVFELNPMIDEFIVLGCDGMYEAYTNQELILCIRDRLKRMRITEQDPSRVIKDIVTGAVHSRKTADNVTGIIVTLCAGIC